MNIKQIERIGSWKGVMDSALTTVGKDGKDVEPSVKWKRSILLSEHSPIRKLMFDIRLRQVKSWVSVHLVRHKYGIEHFVRTQRSDRVSDERPRDEKHQGALVDHDILVNVQALINISRKRLCTAASLETRLAWSLVRDAIAGIDPVVASVMVPECVYRGFCYEMEPQRSRCRYYQSKAFAEQLIAYRSSFHEVDRELLVVPVFPERTMRKVAWWQRLVGWMGKRFRK